jgi:hypothetical protein
MNDTITSVEGLTKEAVQMQFYMDVTVGDDPSEWTQRGSTLCEYMARSGKCLADAKYHLAKKKKSFIIDELSELLDMFNYSATTQKELISNCCGDLERLVTWFDRINRGCTHQIDWIRTLISREKEEMKMNNVREHLDSEFKKIRAELKAQLSNG